MVDLNTVLCDEQSYEECYHKYYNKVIKDFPIRKKKIEVKFPDNTTEKMMVSKFLVNMVFWMPFMRFNKTITKDYIVDTNKLTTDVIADYMDSIIEIFEDDYTNENNLFYDLNLCIADMITELGYFSLDFNKRIGNTISIRDLIMLSEKVDRFNEIIHTRYDGNIDTKYIEDDLKKLTKEILEILGENENCLQDYVNSKEGLNKNQLTQLLINIGPKPDLQENVFPKIVNTNFLTDGMRTVSDYYINSNGGRKAAITNYSKTKQSGYLMRKLSILCMNVELSDTVKDCHTNNYVEVDMNNKDTMIRYDKRYYLDEKKQKLRLFKYSKDNEEKFKGKKILFRSPVTCACGNNQVCQKCYGSLAKINYDIHIGLLAILILTSQVTQKMLSSKHLLKTSTKEIYWNEIFQELFTLNGNTLQLNESIDGINRYSLIINEDEIQDNEEGLNDSEYDEEEGSTSNDGKLTNITKYFRKFTIRRKIDKLPGRKYTEDYEYFEVDNGVDLYMSTYFENTLKRSHLNDNGEYEVAVKDIYVDNPVFYIDIANDGLSAILNSIIDLIDKKERLGTNTYNDMINKFVELCNDSGIIINAVHLELIIRELIKSTTNILERPDFSIKDPEYQILRLSDSILNSGSIVTSISFERFKDQIYKAKSYAKVGSSPLDDFFL